MGADYAAQFQEPSVVAAYHHRPLYPDDVFEILAGLVVDAPRTVLDVGCGQGEIARRLAGRVARVDAVDVSAGMIERGCALAGGDLPGLRWIVGRAEDAPLSPPYALITAAASLHWMEWEVVIPRFHDMLTARGCLALVSVEVLSLPWEVDFPALIPRFSTNRDYAPYRLRDELEQRRLFRTEGERRTAPVPFTQSVAAYIESFHARNGLSRDRMPGDTAAVFDAALLELLAAHGAQEAVELQLVGSVTWGKPLPEGVGSASG